ncbi:MAG TPA: hypothetical protein VHJ76_07225 [Actinomycetota bacterium]|nr:hypothetical protein [Actinomycetota bacterium]
MRGTSQYKKVRCLLAAGALATTMVVAAPTPAHAACTGHFQPGGTLTVAGQPVRIPAVDVAVCQSGSTTSALPTAEVINGPSGSCTTNCFALLLVTNPCCGDTEASVRVELDGSGVDQELVHLDNEDSSFCVVGVGFPAPPVSGCFVSFDPDF